MRHSLFRTTGRQATCAFLLLLVGCSSRTEQPAEFTVAETGVTRPTTAVDARTGTVYVAWVGREEGGANVYLSRLAPGAEAFSAPVRVNGRPGDAAAHGQAPAQVAVGPEGTVYVAWRHIFDGQIRDIAIARSTDGGRTFTDLRRVHADSWHINGCPHAGPAVAVDTQGRVHVLWYTGAQGKAGVYYAMSPGGGAPFGAAKALVAGVPVSQVSAASDGHGGVWLAWEDHKADVVRLAHAESDGAVTRLGISLQGTMPAVDAVGGTWVLAWRDDPRAKARVGQQQTR